MRINLLLSSFILTILSFNTYALGQLGHQLTCELAFQQLSTAAQNKVSHLLSTMERKDIRAINKYNHRKKDETISFAKACTWADAIKRERKYKSFKAWHYINVARDQTEITPNSCQSNCVTQAINYHQQQLVAATSNASQLKALMFMGHWVGDIHQPLHVSFASDLGGNKTKTSASKCENLHWLWDVCLLTEQTNKKQPGQQYQMLLTHLNQQLNAHQNDIKQWKNSSITDWANESLQLTRSKALGYCTLKGNFCVKNKHPLAIDSAYHQQFAPILNERIIQASVRLATLIESSL